MQQNVMMFYGVRKLDIIQDVLFEIWNSVSSFCYCNASYFIIFFRLFLFFTGKQWIHFF